VAAAVVVAVVVAAHADVVDATYVEVGVVFALESGQVDIVAAAVVVVVVDNAGCEAPRESLR
jgi:hypothetical protein